MTPLQQRMIEDSQLRGLSERTQESYGRAVRQLAEHYHKSPARITAEELRAYFLYRKNVKHDSRSASTMALCGIQCFYAHPLKRAWPTRTAALSGLPAHYLCLGAQAPRRHPPSGPRH